MGYIIVKNVLPNHHSWLENIHLDNVRLFVSHDPSPPYETPARLSRSVKPEAFPRRIVKFVGGSPSPRRGDRVSPPKRSRICDSIHSMYRPLRHPACRLTNANKVTLQAPRAEAIHLAGNGTREVQLLQTDSAVSANPDVSKDAMIRK